MIVEFKHLRDVDRSEIIALMNHPLVKRHMPLASENFDEAACEAFINAKEHLWKEYGYGPWAFIADGKFIGWGGLQPEHGDVEIALVLHPQSWGAGKIIYREILRRAFEEMGLKSVIILFPPTRSRIKGLLRDGFKPDGKLNIEGKLFLRYRLTSAGDYSLA